MPKFIEQRLRAEYGNNPHAIYGTMNKIGAMRGNKETAKGKAMEEKHEAKMPKMHMREMRIEVHRGPKHEVTGYTVHHHMMPKASGKSGAFMEHETHQHPFSAGDHEAMMDHVNSHLEDVE
jgi:hypothetical protein